MGKTGGVPQSLLDDVAQVGHVAQGLDRREQRRHQVAQQQDRGRPCPHNASDSQLPILEQGFLKTCNKLSMECNVDGHCQVTVLFV